MSIYKKASDLLKKVEDAKDSKKLVVFLAGTCSDDNKWREEVKSKVKSGVLLLDPFDEKWEAEDNIYDELAGIDIADYIVFFKPGKLSEKEKKFIELSKGKDSYKEFDTVGAIVSFINKLDKKKSVSACLRKMSRSILKVSMPIAELKGNRRIDFFKEQLDSESIKNIYKDLIEGKEIKVPEAFNKEKPFEKLNLMSVNINDFSNSEQIKTFVLPNLKKVKEENPKPMFMYDPLRREYVLK